MSVDLAHPGVVEQDGDVTANFYRVFGSKVRARREADGLTQAELAARVALDRTTVSSIETGRHGVPLHALLDLADALGCTPTELLPSRTELVAQSGEDPFVSRIQTHARGEDES